MQEYKPHPVIIYRYTHDEYQKLLITKAIFSFNIRELPSDILKHLCTYLTDEDLCQAAQVNKQWKNILSPLITKHKPQLPQQVLRQSEEKLVLLESSDSESCYSEYSDEDHD